MFANWQKHKYFLGSERLKQFLTRIHVKPTPRALTSHVCHTVRFSHLAPTSATGSLGRPWPALGYLRWLPADLPLVPLLAVGEVFPVRADQLLHRAHVGATGNNKAEEGPVSLPPFGADPQRGARPHLVAPEKPCWGCKGGNFESCKSARSIWVYNDYHEVEEAVKEISLHSAGVSFSSLSAKSSTSHQNTKKFS